MHWSELIGGDVVISPPHAWQKRFNSCDVEVKPRIDTPVATHIVDELLRKFVDFRRAYEPDGLRRRSSIRSARQSERSGSSPMPVMTSSGLSAISFC